MLRSMLTIFFEYMFLLLRHLFLKDPNCQLSTHYISEFFTLCNLSSCISVCTLFDKFTPYNCYVYGNDRISQLFHPFAAGKSFNRIVGGNVEKFLRQSFPQIILQIVYLNHGAISIPVIVSMISSIISLLISFYNFMSIRPTQITQEDFNQLIVENKQNTPIFEKEFKEKQ